MGSARAAWASRSRTEAAGVCDMEPLFDSGVFRALRDERLFRSVHVPYGVVTWNDEADVSSELPWTGCEAVGEDWRGRLLPEKYFTECDGEEAGS